MDSWNFDSENGNSLCEGWQGTESQACASAQRQANELGAAVAYYRPGHAAIYVDPQEEVTIADDQIESLRGEAEKAQDLDQVALCDAALSGDDAARESVARAILDAQAQVD